jgi:hypothetical protein
MNIPETLKMRSLSGLEKRIKGILRNKNTCGFFGIVSSFTKTVFGMFLAHLVCLKSVK